MQRRSIDDTSPDGIVAPRAGVRYVPFFEMRSVSCDRDARSARAARSKRRCALRTGVALAALVEILGCAGPPYSPGALLAESPCGPDHRGAVAVRRVGCLDVRIALACNPVVPPEHPLVAFTFGNRCGGGAHVDFSAIHASARDADGLVVAVAAHDPRGEIRPGVLGVGGSGREVIEYDPMDRGSRSVASLCLDVTALSDAVGAVPQACLSLSEHECAARR